MPKTTRGGDAKKSELPATLLRSEPKAQRTFAKAHDAAAKEYGEGERAHRVAYAALKHSYEKVGDHWEAKAATAPRAHLLDLARRLDIHGRSTMTKDQLVAAIEKANRRETRRTR